VVGIVPRLYFQYQYPLVLIQLLLVLADRPALGVLIVVFKEDLPLLDL
jgi:hypothetical protein